MSSIFKDAYEGSWSQQFIAGISNFFDLDMHEQTYILLRFAFDHPFLAAPLIFILLIAFMIIVFSIQNYFEKYNSGASRETRLLEKIKKHNEIKTMIDSRTTSENEIKNLFGGLFFGIIFFLIVSTISGRAFGYFLAMQQGWLTYLTGSIISYIGVRQYKLNKYDKHLVVPTPKKAKD